MGGERGRKERERGSLGGGERRRGIQSLVSTQLRWLDRCLLADRRPREQNLFGIVQGGLEPELRKTCVKGYENVNLHLVAFSVPISEMVKRDLPEPLKPFYIGCMLPVSSLSSDIQWILWYVLHLVWICMTVSTPHGPQ